MKPAKEVLVNEKAGSTDEIQATVPLRVSRGARIEMSRAIDALTNLDWLGPRVNGPAEREDLRRISAVLELPIFDGSAPGPIRKTALVDIGIPAALAGSLVVQVGSEGKIRPASQWKGARTLEDAIADPVIGQDTSLRDPAIMGA